MLKNGESLHSYGVEEGSVLHLVERPVETAAESAQSRPRLNLPLSLPLGPRGQTSVLYRTVEVDPTNPIGVAAQITNSLMGAFNSFMSASGMSPADDSSAPSHPPHPPHPPQPRQPRQATSESDPVMGAGGAASGAGRVYSRPTTTRTGSETHLGAHQLVRTDTNRALNNLIEDLNRLTTHSDGSDLFSSIPNDGSSTATPECQLLEETLRCFERTYWMLASACREVREGVQAGRVPWDRLHNFTGMLQEMPLLMLVQRRLLTSLRAREGVLVEMPRLLDVPSFLDREIANEAVMEQDASLLFEPPE